MLVSSGGILSIDNWDGGDECRDYGLTLHWKNSNRSRICMKEYYGRIGVV